MPGTGKSTVGVILAKYLGYDFIDTDILIAAREGRSLPQILDAEGIDGFLRIEGDTGASIDRTGTVIATGGSMVLSERAMENLRRNGVVVWLKTPIDELERRFALSSRRDRGVAAPDNMTTEEIYSSRLPFYEKYADVVIECAQGTEACVSQVMAAVEGII